MLRRVALLVAVLALAACSQSTDTVPRLGDLPAGDLPEGEAAATFTVDTFDHGTFALSQHLAEDGRPVFLNLWASWCAPCRAEMPDIDEAAIRNPDVAFIGVAVKDELNAAQGFADEIGVAYPLAFDETNAVDDGYGPIGLPASYIISSEGIIVERIFGPVTGEQIDEKLAQHFG